MKAYTTSQVAEELGVCKNTIFYWEKTGKIPKPKREPVSSYRIWTAGDVKKLKFHIKNGKGGGHKRESLS